MFASCANLSSVTCLATDISALDCVTGWLSGVSAFGTFTKSEQMHNWPVGTENGIPSGWEVKGNQEPTGTPLTLEAVSSAATVTFVNKADGPVWYKINGGEKQTIASGETKEIALAAAGDKVAFYGNNAAYAKDLLDDGLVLISYYSSNIACSAPCYVYGNVMSLVSSYDYDNAKILYKKAFNGLFQNNANIKNKDGEDLLLPATTLAERCYYAMFRGCTSLTAAPALPATTLAQSCYYQMFLGCSSLTAAPALPATTLADSCYAWMFSGCCSLTTPPETLPATTLAKECYRSMFSSCSRLTAAPALPATTLAASCYDSMFVYCSSLTAAPSLPATTLTEGCYTNMFKECSSLSNITCLATDISADNCLTGWVGGVNASGTFTKAASMTSWPQGESGIPSGWTVVDYQP